MCDKKQNKLFEKPFYAFDMRYLVCVNHCVMKKPQNVNFGVSGSYAKGDLTTST